MNANPACTSTFSIVAVDPGQGCLGAAVASCCLAVGAQVPHVRQSVGVVNTQHYFNPRLAGELLDRMASGTTPTEALSETLRDDPDAENRQFVVISASGAKAVWTGGKCLAPHAQKEGLHCAAAGNRLVSPAVVEAMISTFQDTAEQVFAERLLLALEAGEREGGDALGHESAALLVVPAHIREDWPLNLVDLRIDHHTDPVRELRRIYAIFASRHTGYFDW